MDRGRVELQVLGASLVLFLLILAFAFFTGSTFGQRCQKAYSSAPDVSQCVMRLADGGPLFKGGGRGP